jgi:GTP-binding protein EngB required for normal cell division
LRVGHHTFDNTASDARISRHLPLLSLIDVARELDSQRIEREARALAERVADKRFFVACLGQFKRGKSSLLNALVGASVLPTGVVPVTAIVTILRYGPILHAEVHFENGSRQQVPAESIADYVSEERNPENSRGVAAVEVFVPAALLASGMCLVDTPGIGSVFAGNTAVTKAFVPHIDAALIVLGADPPISGEELLLLEDLASQVNEIVIVLSKADRLTAGECEEAIEFARRTLIQKIKRDVGRVFQVSAAEWLNGGGPSRDAPALIAELERLARDCGPALVEAAEKRGIQRLAGHLLREIDNLRDALIAPAEESQRIASRLREVIADAERSLSDLSHLFKAEQERVNRRCTERRDSFLYRTIPAARKEFHDAILQATERTGTELHDRATDIAQSISRRLLNQWLEEERPAAEAMYRESAHRFVQLANDFLKRVTESGDPRLADLPSAVSEESGFRVKGKLYFGEHFGFPRQTVAEWIVGIFKSRRRQLEIVEKKVARYLVTLLSLNSTRILNDFDAIVRESGRRLEAEIRGMLNELRTTAESTLSRAEATRAAGTEAVRSSLERLERLRAKVMMASERAANGHS